MANVTTYIGIDAHKADLYVAKLVGNEQMPTAWQVANEPRAVRRLANKLVREAARAGSPVLLRSGAVRIRVAAPDRGGRPGDL